MKGWLTFWIALIAIGGIASWIEESFGTRAGEWFTCSTVGLLVIGVLITRAAHKARIEREVDALVSEHRNGDPGIFTEWFDNNTSKHSDQFRIAEAANAILRVYGGRHVINELVNEGYQPVLYDDISDVFGDQRAGQIMFEVLAIANRPGFLAHLAAFGLGVFLGHKATARR